MIGFDPVDQCHVTRRAHETPDPIQSLFIQRIVRGMFAHDIEPDMERRPVVDRGSAELGRNVGIFPDPPALGAGLRFVLALADE